MLQMPDSSPTAAGEYSSTAAATPASSNAEARFAKARIAGIAGSALLLIGGLGPQAKLALGNLSGAVSDALTGQSVSEPFVVSGVVYVVLAILAGAGLYRLRLTTDPQMAARRLIGVASVLALVFSLVGFIEVSGNSVDGMIAPGWGLYVSLIAAVAVFGSAVVTGRGVKQLSKAA